MNNLTFNNQHKSRKFKLGILLNYLYGGVFEIIVFDIFVLGFAGVLK